MQAKQSPTYKSKYADFDWFKQYVDYLLLNDTQTKIP